MVVTVVWGAAYLAEAAARVIIVQNASAGSALAVSKVLPYAVAGVLIAWTIGYGRSETPRRSDGRRYAAAAAEAEAGAGAKTEAEAEAETEAEEEEEVEDQDRDR